MSKRIMLNQRPGKFISRAAFKKFLERHKNRKFKSNCISNCPLAEATGYFVDGTEYGLYAVVNEPIIGPTKPLPGWAVRFVDMWDALKGVKTGARALKILNLEDERTRLEKEIERLKNRLASIGG